jgi:hypothetical protein
MENYFALFLSLFMCFTTVALIGQDVDQKNDLLQCVERYYGSNDLLVNGRPYVPVNTKAYSHPYFLSKAFSPGVLFIKDQQFENVQLKLNMEKGQLILKETLTNGIPVQLIITPSLVDSFYISHHFFVNNTIISNEIEKIGFMQQLFAGDLSFYRQQIKLFQPKYSQLHPSGRYGAAEKKYYLVTSSGLLKVGNKKAFLAFFGDNKRTVKRYMKQQSIRFKKASDAQFYNLLKYCNELF